MLSKKKRKKSNGNMVTGYIKKSISSGTKEGMTVLLNQELSEKWIIWSCSGTTTLSVWNP